MAGGRRGGDLTRVFAAVPVSDGLDLEQVVLGEHLVDGFEPEVRRVRQAPDRQQMQVRMSNP